MKINLIIFLCFSIISMKPIFAGEKSVPTLTDENIDKYSKEATVKTQELLRSKKQRADSVKSGDGKKADDYVNQITGHDDKLAQQIYDISADVLPLLVNRANGDPKEMQRLVKEYSDNPEAFANQWSPEEKKKLHDLSLKLPQPVSQK